MSISPDYALSLSNARSETLVQESAGAIIRQIETALQTDFNGKEFQHTVVSQTARAQMLVEEHFSDYWHVKSEPLGASTRFILRPKEGVSVDVRPK